LITTHLPKNLITCYLGAEILGALLASIFVKYAIGTNANLGANVPNYNFQLPVIFGVEVFASYLLMIVILLVVYTKGLKGFSGIAIEELLV
jgi:aquaporin Z